MGMVVGSQACSSLTASMPAQDSEHPLSLRLLSDGTAIQATSTCTNELELKSVPGLAMAVHKAYYGMAAHNAQDVLCFTVPVTHLLKCAHIIELFADDALECRRSCGHSL